MVYWRFVYTNSFILSKSIEPDYYFCKNDIRLHKFNLRNSPSEINKDCSINEAAMALGYLKIWDCGKLKFEKVLLPRS